MHENYKQWLKDGCPKVYCQCNCNNEIIINKYHKYLGVPRYIKGHNTSWNKGKGKIHESYQKWLDDGCPKIYCECPCHGEITIKEYCKFHGIPKYIHGHNNFDILQSKECIKKSAKNRCGQKRLSVTGDLNPSRRPEVIEKLSGINNHFYGKHHNEISKQKIRDNKPDQSGEKNPMYGKTPSKLTGTGKGSYYDSPLQGKIWLRSSYEIAYAKYLDEHKILWYYEIETFDLGDTTYTPDFFLVKENKFIEIKGYMTNKAKNKINKFLDQYPWNLEILYKEDLIGLKIKLCKKYGVK